MLVLTARAESSTPFTSQGLCFKEYFISCGCRDVIPNENQKVALTFQEDQHISLEQLCQMQSYLRLTAEQKVSVSVNKTIIRNHIKKVVHGESSKRGSRSLSEEVFQVCFGQFISRRKIKSTRLSSLKAKLKVRSIHNF